MPLSSRAALCVLAAFCALIVLALAGIGGFPGEARAQAEPAADSLPTPQQTDQVARLLGEALRRVRDGDVEGARTAVAQAAAILPGSPAVGATRREVAELSTPAAQLALLLDRARLAIARGDAPGAEAALTKAERLDPTAPEIGRLRQDLQAERRRDARLDRRVAVLLSEMRQAIARQDFAAAARALNAAERLDIRDPAIDPARRELARAEEEGGPRSR